MHAAETHPNGDDDQANHRRREVGSGRDVEFVSDGKHHEQQQSGADDLIEKSRLRPRGKCRESCKDAGGLFQLRIELMKGRQIVSVYQGGRKECAGRLRDGIRHNLAPGKTTEHRQR